jgi:predicted GNAT family acetyltransferase
LAAGWEHCALFAEETNTAAIKAYQKIGFEPICDYDEYEFTDN